MEFFIPSLHHLFKKMEQMKHQSIHFHKDIYQQSYPRIEYNQVLFVEFFIHANIQDFKNFIIWIKLIITGFFE